MAVWLKRLGIALAVLIVLLAATVAGALMLVDTAALKRVVSEQVEENTGRELAIEGDLGISIFPWLGFELGQARLANAAGFEERPFLTLERAELRVRLLPLLRREVAVDRVVLHGLEVNLARNAAGRGNWEDLAAAPDEAPDAPGAEGTPTPADEPPAAAPAFDLRVEGLDVRDADLHWRDASTGQSVSIRDLQLETGVLARGVVTPVRLQARLEPSDAPSVAIDLQTEAGFEPETRRLRLPGFAVELDARGDTLPGGKLAARIGGDIEADLDAGHLRIDDLAVRLDETRMTGSLQARTGEIPAVSLQLAADVIDLDRYLPPPATGSEAAGTVDGGGSAGAEAGDPVATLPLEAMRGLRAEAGLDVGRLVARGLEASDVVLRARVDDGLLVLERLSANAAGGTLRLDGRLDGRTDRPAAGMEVRIDGIRAGPLLQALTGNVPVNGRLDSGIALDTAGATLDEWIGALDGEVAATFSDGAVEGINIAQRIRVAWARLQGERVEQAATERRTDFSRLHFAGTIRDGVLRSDTLDLRAPLLRAGGAGTVDLVRRQVDYVARVRVTGTLQGQGGAGLDEVTGLEIPLRFRGPLSGPDIELALADALEAKARAKKEELKQQAKEAEKAAQKEIDEAVDKEKQELERRKKREKEKAKQKLEQELKGLFD